MIEYPRYWTCEATAGRLDEYLRLTLALAEALAIAEHCEACEWCAQLLRVKVELRLEVGVGELRG